MRKEIVKTLNNIATLLELKGENSFKIRAYKTGSEIIENFSGDIEQIAKDEKLDEIKGIGKATKRVLTCHPIKFLGGGEGFDPVIKELKGKK